MSISNLRKNQHLMWRAGFGPGLEDLKTLSTESPKSLWRKMLLDSVGTPAYIDVADNEVRSAYIKASLELKRSANALMNAGNSAGQKNTSKEVAEKKDQSPSEADRRQLAQRSRDNIKSLNLTWLDQMVTSKQQLREKVSLFWHGHFATNSGNILHQQKLLDIIRVNALGNFGTLLKEVSKSASMLNYLNNNQNRKNRPNENFAREVMELFTMGRGSYSEKDIKEAARAFTGWGATPSGEFVFRLQQHDENEKTFLGHKGNFKGDDILDILLEQKETAYFITGKIYRYFVNDKANEKNIRVLADRFYSSGYDISKLLSDIFQSEWFFDSENIGNHIKSPVELLVGIRRTFDPVIENKPGQLLLQRLLGQILFYPPNVAGWPGAFNWIDGSSLMLRMQIPKLMFETGNLNMSPKENDDQMMGMTDLQDEKVRRKGKAAQYIKATVNWNKYFEIFDKTKRDQLAKHISDLMLIPALTNQQILTCSFTDAESRESFIKGTTIQLMCLPEYQLC
jgi:uncharacterized protein (DUF1800 family)